MKLVKAEKIEGGKFELQISVDKATFDEAVTKAFQQESKKITVPGFRKGKAPRAIIEKMYGKEVFYETAINDLIPGVYNDAVKESGISPVAQPEMDIVSLDENGLVLSAKVYVKPDVELSAYKGLTATRTVAPVTDAELDAEINTVRERNSRETEVMGRAAESGDTAVIDYEGFCEGKAFDGGKGENFALKLGSGTFIPGFEDQVIGHKVDDAFDVNVTFPTEYHSKDLAGKDATFKCKIHALTKVELPELDDDFAKDVSEFDTFDAYKADLKAKIQKRHEQSADSAVDEALVDELISGLKADIPAPMFDAEAENFLRDYDNRLRMSGLDLNTYLKYTGMTLDKLREQFRPQAERQVKARLALEKIVELEKIEATAEDIDGEYNRIATAYNMPVDKVKESVPEDAISEDMKVKKAMEFLRSNATVTDAAPETAKTEKKPAAKKTATKKTTAEKAETPKTAAKKTATKTTAKKPTAKKEAKEEAPEADEKA